MSELSEPPAPSIRSRVAVALSLAGAALLLLSLWWTLADDAHALAGLASGCAGLACWLLAPRIAPGRELQRR